MEYEAFREKVLEGLLEICGGSTQVRTEKMLKNNGKHYDGIQLNTGGTDGKICLVIPLEWFYGVYCGGDMSIAGCVRAIYEIGEEHKEVGGITKMLQKLRDWEQAKESIYPVLLSTKDNQEMLERVVSTPMLDLSVAYIFRGKVDSRYAGIKISYQMLEAYGISAEELHRQALENLVDDGYCFRGIKSFVMGQVCGESYGKNQYEDGKEEDIYIFTNGVMFYGAAGILDRKRVREFANGRSFYILPSSIHETIFVPADGRENAEPYSRMVRSINETELDIEERLSDHAYFYDAGTDEIRMCA